MEIKQIKQLEEGVVIKRRKRAERMTEAEHNEDGNRTRYKTEELMVLKCYKHYVSFRQLEPPYLTVSITNNELYQMGEYNEKDFVREFTR